MIMSIEFRLQYVLDELSVSSNRVAVESKTRPGTVLALAKGQMRRLDIDTIDKILIELNRMAADKGMSIRYGIEDVIRYVSDE